MPMANGFRYADGLKMFEDRIHCSRERRCLNKTLS
jgi:hypothetical protein